MENLFTWLCSGAWQHPEGPGKAEIFLPEEEQKGSEAFHDHSWHGGPEEERAETWQTWYDHASWLVVHWVQVHNFSIDPWSFFTCFSRPAHQLLNNFPYDIQIMNYLPFKSRPFLFHCFYVFSCAYRNCIADVVLYFLFMFPWTRVISVDNNLVQLETMDGQPLSTKTPYASVKPLRMYLS